MITPAASPITEYEWFQIDDLVNCCYIEDGWDENFVWCLSGKTHLTDLQRLKLSKIAHKYFPEKYPETRYT